ncbi:MAG TPA: phosphoribosylformylglycinamidine cyclo-ligase [Candidatus Obscuribacterales bacterium]
MDPLTYADAGVNIERAESFVTRLKKQANRPGHKQMWNAAGGYASIYPLAGDTAVAVTTDGVGTKLLVAEELEEHGTIGIDLVAMVANDLICVGATPTMFLDYFAVGTLQDKLADAIISGIIEGCDQAGMILAGGETAEMPGVYEPGKYDLAGFAVGNVTKKTLITGDRIAPGQKVIGVASSGIHSNGLSLARKVLKGNRAAMSKLLKPTLIYVKPVVELFNSLPSSITGMAHITGGGWRNMFRLSDKVGFQIDSPLPIPDILAEIGKFVKPDEMYRTFNMGMGLVIIAETHAEKIVETFTLAGFNAQVVGVVTDKAKTLTVPSLKLTIHD